MQYWNDLEGSTFFSMVFSNRIEIGEIKLFSIDIDSNQSLVTMAFDIREVPDKPPRKWQSAQYNACRIGITCSEVESITIKNLPTNTPLKLTILGNDLRFKVTAISENSAIEFTTSFLRLRDPTVYLTETPF
ncbi:Imm50 family immunity protein [Pseudomonas sp. R45(2017)]|uniref:Imm50 family immunity protein n=1 Tax=Pseudomonas sp. R45(2017) TaxID=1981678 RepID=UPI000A1F69FD|nr:Imm50 family immunity protein [Pseudomonas sp. R45(2017)]